MPFDPRVAPRVPVLPVRVDPTGERGPTRAQARGRHWRRVGYDAHVPVGADPEVVEQRIADATAHLTPGGGVTAWAGLRMAGAASFDGCGRRGVDPVVLALGRTAGRRRPPGIVLSYEPVDVEVFDIHGVAVLQPVRALFDEVRRLDDWREGVVAVDMAAAAGVTSIARLAAYTAAHSSWRRASRLAPVLRHACEHALSPQESRLRLVWTLDAGLPTPLVNRTVRTSDGRFVCIPDLFDEEAGVVVEYEGADHRAPDRHASDAARHERCREVGLEYCMVTGPDMRSLPFVVARLRAARARAKFLPPERRAWVVTSRTEESLDARLDRCEQVAAAAWQLRGARLRPW